MNGPSPAYAFSLGLVAAVNPCGFALLPAYLSFYLGIEPTSTATHPTVSESSRVGNAGQSSPDGGGVVRSVVIGATMTAGFVTVFAVIGTAWSSISSLVGARLPWVTAAMGVALIGLGIAMVAGKQPTISLPTVHVDASRREIGSMFLFGISYAVASLSCTIPLFIGTMTTAFDQSFAGGLLTFVMYGLGMGALVTLLTITVGLARTGLLRVLRRSLPYVGRLSGVLIIGAGAIVAYYGWAETRQLALDSRGTGFAVTLSDAQSSVQRRIEDFGSVRLGLIAAIIIGGSVAISVILRHGKRGPSEPSPSS